MHHGRHLGWREDEEDRHTELHDCLRMDLLCCTYFLIDLRSEVVFVLLTAARKGSRNAMIKSLAFCK